MNAEERRIRHNELNAAWRAKNPDYFKNYASMHVQELRDYQKNYTETVRKANPEKLKLQRQTTRKNFKQKVLDVLGCKCSNADCRWLNEDGTLGCTDWRLLEVDHINGDGAKERKELGYWKIMYSILEFGAQGKYQTLCKCCNHLKRIKNGEHGKGKPA